MTPAQELHQAAERLRELAKETGDGYWKAERIFWKVKSPVMPDAFWWEVSDPAGSVAMCTTQDDEEGDTAVARAHWIAALGPAVAEPLARLLTEAANDLDNNDAHPFKYAHHLAFARAINGTETTR